MKKATCLAVACTIVPAVAGAADRTVQSGVKTEIATHSRFDRDCKPVRVDIKVLTGPNYGTVTHEPKDMVVPAQNPKGEKQPSKCVGRTIQGIAVFYQSKPGFTGEDKVRYYRHDPNNPKDRFNAEFEYTITVK